MILVRVLLQETVSKQNRTYFMTLCDIKKQSKPMLVMAPFCNKNRNQTENAILQTKIAFFVCLQDEVLAQPNRA